jgi:hypothetical protein
LPAIPALEFSNLELASRQVPKTSESLSCASPMAFLKTKARGFHWSLVTGEDASDSVISHSSFLKRELLSYYRLLSIVFLQKFAIIYILFIS